MRICTTERALALSELSAASAAGTHREGVCVGTAAAVIPDARVGWRRPRWNGSGGGGDCATPAGEPGSVARALWERLVDSQGRRVEWEGWVVQSL